MKKLWNLLFIIGMIFMIFLSTMSFSLKEKNENFLSDEIVLNIFVNRVDSEKNNEQITKELLDYSRAEEINIYRSFKSFETASEVQETIYLANGNDQKAANYLNLKDMSILNGDFSFNNSEMNLFDNNQRIYINNFLASIEEGIGGEYYFQASVDKIVSIESKLSDLGMVYVKNNNNQSVSSYLSIFFGIIDVPGGSAILLSLFVFISMFIFLSLFETFIRFKEIAIYKMMGYKERSIIYDILKSKLKYICLFSLLYFITILLYDIVFKDAIKLFDYVVFSMIYLLIYIIITLLITLFSLGFLKIVSIKEMIKGKKNIKFIRRANYIALAILTIIMFSFTNVIINVAVSLNGQIENLEKYKVFENYSYTRTASGAKDYPSATNEERMESEARLEKNLHEFTKKNYDDVVLFAPGDYAKNDCSTLNFSYNCSVPTLLVNENYIKNINQLATIGDISLDPYKLNIIVPEGYYQDNVDNLIVDQTNYLKFLLDQEVTTNVIKYENQKVPIVKKINGYKYDDLDNPIIIVYTKQNFEKMVYSNQILYYSMGNMFIRSSSNTKSYAEIEPKLKEYELNDVIRTSTNVYSLVLENIENLKSELVYYIISLITLIIIYINVIYFTTITYIEENKKKLAIMNVLGYDFFSIYSNYISINLVILTFSTMVYFLLNDFSSYVLLIIILEIFVVLMTLFIKGKNNIVDSIKKG